MLAANSQAKINLTLRVGPLRPDGFHPVESLVTRVGLCDRVAITPHAESNWALTCSDPKIPCDESNLALRAVRVLAAAFPGQRPGGSIHIEKNIPAGAGLGGGSSNAAAMLRLLNSYWKLNCPDAKLAQIGARLGSDVPLFLGPTPCVVRGRGEEITPTPVRLPEWVVLILPDLHCATAAVYAAFDRLPPPPVHPPIAEVIAAASRTADAFMSALFNDLEPAAFAVEPRLATLFERLQAISGGLIRLTGSGAAMFWLFDDEPAAIEFAHRVESEGVRSVVVTACATAL